MKSNEKTNRQHCGFVGEPEQELELELEQFPENLQDKAKASFDAGDVEGFLGWADSKLGMRIVCENISHLKSRGLFEQALITAFTGTHTNDLGFDVGILSWIFKQADRKKLLAAGDELPLGEVFTIYRDVTCEEDWGEDWEDEEDFRDLLSYSWTLDLDKACWFAVRLGQEGSAIYRAKVKREEILCYRNQQQEVICKPEKCDRLSLEEAEIREKAENSRRHE